MGRYIVKWPMLTAKALIRLPNWAIESGPGQSNQGLCCRDFQSTVKEEFISKVGSGLIILGKYER